MYKGEKRSWLKHIDFTVIDILCTQLAYVLAYRIRFGAGCGLPYFESLYERLAIVIVLLQICVIFFAEPYKSILRRDKFEELKRVIVSCSFEAMAVILYMFCVQMSKEYSRITIGYFWIISIPITYCAHLVWKRFIRRMVVEDRNRSIMLLLVSDDMAEPCIRSFEQNRYRNFVVKGIVVTDKDRKGEVIRDVPIVANNSDYLEYIRTHVVDEVFINCNDIQESARLTTEVLEMGVTVHYILMQDTGISSTQVVEKVGQYTVLTSSLNIASFRQTFIKRCLDIFGSIVGLVFTLIALLIFAPIIKHQSPGPVFFTQTRVGKNGRKFKLYKFRSMYVDAEKRKAELMAENKMDGHMFKMEDDPRIIPIGRFMRKYSIDELPQFWNILKGDMSLVGTRPPTEDEYVQYERHHRARLGIKPGLTGMWQVSGRSNITDFEEVVALDTEYISNWNLGMDIKILFKTIAVVLKGNGAE